MTEDKTFENVEPDWTYINVKPYTVKKLATVMGFVNYKTRSDFLDELVDALYEILKKTLACEIKNEGMPSPRGYVLASLIDGLTLKLAFIEKPIVGQYKEDFGLSDADSRKKLLEKVEKDFEKLDKKEKTEIKLEGKLRRKDEKR
jgi:hypothetical protein